MHSLPWVHRDPVYKARWVGGQNSLPAHTCAKKTQPGNKGVAYMACHKRVACVDISPASMFPWQCVTGRDTCSKEWGGGKVSRRNRTPRNSFPPSESIEAHEDFYSEFWVRRAENTYFFSFLWARWCNVCKDCFLRKDHRLSWSGPGPVSGSCMFLNPSRATGLSIWLSI